jgi:hypothetical protein
MKSKGQQRRISTQVGHLPGNDGQLLVVEGLATRWLADSTHTGPLPRATKTRTIGCLVMALQPSPFTIRRNPVDRLLDKRNAYHVLLLVGSEEGTFPVACHLARGTPEKKKSHQEGGAERGRPLFL